MKTINKPWGEDLRQKRKLKTIIPKKVKSSFSVAVLIIFLISCTKQNQRNMVFESAEFVIEVPKHLTWVKFGDKWNKGCFNYLIANCSKDTLINYLGLPSKDVLRGNIRWIEIECYNVKDVGSGGEVLSDIDTAYLEMFWLTNGQIGTPKIRPSYTSRSYLFSVENSGTLVRRVGESKLLFHSLDTNFLRMVEGVRIEEFKIE